MTIYHLTTAQTFSASFPPSGVPLPTSAGSPRISGISKYLHGCVKIVLSEISLKKKMNNYLSNKDIYNMNILVGIYIK